LDLDANMLLRMLVPNRWSLDSAVLHAADGRMLGHISACTVPANVPQSFSRVLGKLRLAWNTLFLCLPADGLSFNSTITRNPKEAVACLLTPRLHHTVVLFAVVFPKL